TVFVLGPLVTTSGHYWQATTWRYLLSAGLVAQYELPGVFADHPRDVVNGSLWSLGPEAGGYVLLALLALAPLTASVAVRTTLLVAGGLGQAVLPLAGPHRVLVVAVCCLVAGSLL